ncbi:MAG: HIT family protein [Bacilli bacterium]|nr:HIT family protein [Bacilli bacterium]
MDIFCKIVNGEIPSYKLYEDEKVVVFLDINPNTLGHTLIVPKNHFLDLYDIDNDTLTHIMETARKIGKLLEKKLNTDGLTIAQNNGIAEEVKHYHMHLIPQYKNKPKTIPVEEVFNILTK